MLKRSAIFFLAATLLFSSCKKDKKAEPEPVVQYYPLEVKRTASYMPGVVVVSTYKYDASNNVFRENVTSDGILTDYYLYYYNAAGKLKKREHYNADNVLTEHDEYIFNTMNQATQLNHTMFHQPGVAMFHHYLTYHYYPDGKVQQVSEVWPKSRTMLAADQEQYRYTYQVNNATFQKGLHDNKINPSDSYVEEFELDGKLNPYSAINITNLPALGNVTKRTTKDLAGNVKNTVQYKISYNPAGYPDTITEMHANGIKKTETYTYKAF